MEAAYLEKRKSCPICDSERLAAGFRVWYWRENALDYSDCESCGATFANPMPSDELISRGNDALARAYQQGRSFENEFVEARQAYLRGKLLARKLGRWKRKGRLLELGCFRGFFALGFKENSDWEVEGLEISRDLCSFVNDVVGVRCHLGTLEQASLPQAHYDFIVCHDLIEHINQPRVFLKTLGAVLARGGRVQIITPNGKQDLGYTRRAHAAGVAMPMLLNHIMYFRTGTLKLALRSAGLTPLKIYCYDVRHALKDFGWLGMGKPAAVSSPIPSMEETLQLREAKTLAQTLWTPEKVRELRGHRKTSLAYGFVKEILPNAFAPRMPATLEIGHEIYALAEKR